MKKLYYSSFKWSFGEMVVGICEDKLCIFDWKYRKMREQVDARVCKYLGATIEEMEQHPLLDHFTQQFDEYANSERSNFDLPIELCGTDFQQEVWQALMDIPFGKTKSYADLSSDIDNPDAIRAVASANGANALAIVIPCHRIIGSDGDLVGYAGGLNTKKRLLELEGALKDDQLSLF